LATVFLSATFVVTAVLFAFFPPLGDETLIAAPGMVAQSLHTLG
jgi:hypothetical protein